MADPEVDLFAGMKKKKKKQTVIEVEDTPEALPPAADARPAEPAAPVEEEQQQPKPSASTETAEEEKTEAAAPVDGGDAAGATEDGDFFADMKKKKKKSKKEIPLDLETATSSAEPATLDGLDVPMKKKKSKKQAQDFAKELDEMDAEQEEAAAAAADDGEDGEEAGDRTTGADGVSEGQEPWVVENREATYPELLKRFFTLLHQHDPELAGEKKRYTIAPPQVAREGTKKTVFANVSDICRRMHRQPEHVIQFLYSELGTQGSVDGAQRLIMKGRYNQKQIENVLRKYINEYVTCKICKSPDTLLEKDNRLYFINCESCGSRRSVAAIKAGFQAQIGKRIKPT